MKSRYNDEKQFAAINHGSGPALVSAGPGSGKTYVITNRIHNLVSKLGVSPEKILVITFTKAAAGEMRERYLKLSDSLSTDVAFGTFHSVYFNFLRYFKSKSVYKIIELNKQKELINNIITSSSLFSKNIYFDNVNPEDLISAISYYKSTGFSYPSDFPKELFEDFYHQYEECMNASERMDYDDILLKCYDMLKENLDYCDILKHKFDYILVDEFQDINHIQYDILKLIVNENRNLFVVGDDDQSIYGFRGASPKVMSDFLIDFPNTKIISLNYNYRSKKNIIDAADKLISHNIVRIKKDKHYCINTAEAGIFETNFYSSKEEQYQSIKNIYLQQQNLGNSVAILVRTNKDVFSIKEYMMNSLVVSWNENIPADLKNEIYTDLRAYISFALYNDRASILRIANCPNRNLPRNIFIDEKINLSELIIKFQGTYKGIGISVLKRHFDILSKSSPFAFVTYVLNIIGYKEYLFDKYSILKKESEKIFNELLDTARNTTGLNNLSEKLYVSEITTKDDETNKFNIMTFHASKGLEFDTVIIPDVNEGKIPGRASVKSDDTEEERRLFYVAMTRAKNRLVVTYVKGNSGMRVLPSRFITEFLDK